SHLSARVWRAPPRACRPHLRLHPDMLLSNAENRKTRVGAGDLLGRAAGPHLSAAEPLRPELDCGCSPSDRFIARPPTGNSAASGPRETQTGISVARFSSRIHLRNSLVRRELLLGLQHHEAVRRHQPCRSCRSPHLVLSLSRPLSRSL